MSVQSGGDVVSLLLEPGTLTYRRLRPPASSPVKLPLTRAGGGVDLSRFDGHSEKRESTRGGVDDGAGTEAEEVLG